MLWRRGEHQGCIHSAGTVISIFSFCKRFPLCMQAKVRRYLSSTWGMGHIFLLRAVRRQACTLFSFPHEFFVGVGAFAHLICFLAGNGRSNRLEAEGNVQSSGLGSILGIGQAGIAIRVAVGALHAAIYTFRDVRKVGPPRPRATSDQPERP